MRKFILYVFLCSSLYASHRKSMYDDTFNNEGRFHLGVIASILLNRSCIIPNDVWSMQKNFDSLARYLIPQRQLRRLRRQQQRHFCRECLAKQFSKLKERLEKEVSLLVDNYQNGFNVYEFEMEDFLERVAVSEFGIESGTIFDEQHFFLVERPFQKDQYQ